MKVHLTFYIILFGTFFSIKSKSFTILNYINDYYVGQNNPATISLTINYTNNDINKSCPKQITLKRYESVIIDCSIESIDIKGIDGKINNLEQHFIIPSLTPLNIINVDFNGKNLNAWMADPQEGQQ